MTDGPTSDPIVICGAARTPLGAFQGALSDVPATKLGAVAIRAALERAGVGPDAVDEVLMGNVLPAGLGQAPARQAALAAGAEAFITGEVSEPTVHFAREEGIHFIAAGHHATERYGVQALGEYLAGQFPLEHRYFEVDNPV